MVRVRGSLLVLVYHSHLLEIPCFISVFSNNYFFLLFPVMWHSHSLVLGLMHVNWVKVILVMVHGKKKYILLSYFYLSLLQVSCPFLFYSIKIRGHTNIYCYCSCSFAILLFLILLPCVHNFMTVSLFPLWHVAKSWVYAKMWKPILGVDHGKKSLEMFHFFKYVNVILFPVFCLFHINTSTRGH